MTHLKPPVATPIPHTLEMHGHVRVDNYFWLRDRDNPEVMAYLQAENAYTEAVMAHTTTLQKTLYNDMLARVQETDISVPVRLDAYDYYVRTQAGQQYPLYCRRRRDDEASETVLLDLNTEALQQAYLRLGLYKVSPNHAFLAYSVDTVGAEDFTVYVKDLRTGTLLPDCLPHTAYVLEWGNDNQTLFYTTRDQARRSYKLHRHTLGTDPREDVEVYCEPDELYRVSLYKTKDQVYLVLNILSRETSELHVLAADTPQGVWQCIQPRQPGMRYHLEHRQGVYYILTNDAAKNFRVMTAPVAAPGRANWQEYVPHRDTVRLDDLEVFADYIVLYGQENGLKTLTIRHIDSGDTHNVVFAEPAYTIVRDSNPDFYSDMFRYTYMSMITPMTIYDYNMRTRSQEIKKQQPVLGDFKPEDYQTERVLATAADGTQVPISLIYKRGLQRHGNNPCVLVGYGAYGFNTEPQFDSNRFSLIDRGMIYALAHLRGGQEMGRQWYDEGKLLNKKNTFTDFIACAEALIQHRYTCSERLAITGGSAGGLLIGAVINMAPSLARVAVAHVPFVDVITTMLDASLPLTVGEYEEWGDPNDEAYYDYMLSYSPYDNITAQAYPHLLVTASLHDQRVQYWEPAKWVAKLRAHTTSNSRILLRTNMQAGHSGASGRYEALQEVAFDYAFILDTLGVEILSPPRPSPARGEGGSTWVK